jgi:hypothetical protein
LPGCPSVAASGPLLPPAFVFLDDNSDRGVQLLKLCSRGLRLKQRRSVDRVPRGGFFFFFLIHILLL